MSREIFQGHRVPVRACAAAALQWVALLVLLWLRSRLLKMPLPVLLWLDDTFPLEMIGNGLQCHGRLLSYAWWGDYLISSGVSGWYFIKATHQETGRHYYALGCSGSYGIIRIGYEIKPSCGHLWGDDKVRRVVFYREKLF